MKDLKQPAETQDVILVDDSKKRDYLLPASILIAGLAISGSIVYLVGSKNSPRVAAPNDGGSQLAALNTGSVAPEVTSRDVILGDPKAPVTLIEYGDYQCPFCGRFFSQVEPPLRENYIKTGKLRMVFRNLQFLGSESTAAAEAAECAKDQSKFWAYHDVLYRAEIEDGHENNGNLTRELFIKLARDLKLDTGAFTGCVDSGKYAERVKQDTSNAQDAGFSSTPTSFVNDQKLVGALPYAQFKAVIDNFLKTK